MALIKKSSLAEEVAKLIRERIKIGVYPLESKLPTEPELMKVFGVGRSSIREAIRILTNGGYLMVQQGVGTFVIRTHGHEALGVVFENARLSDLLEVRELLELRIAEKAAMNRTSKDLRGIEAALKKRKKAADQADVQGCIEADISFHQAIADACGNSILTELYSTSSKYVLETFSQIYQTAKAFLDTHDSHSRLYQAIENKDSKEAAKVAKEIIGTV